MTCRPVAIEPELGVTRRHAQPFEGDYYSVVVTDPVGGAWSADGYGQRLTYQCAQDASAGGVRCIAETSQYGKQEASARGGYPWPGNVRELQNSLRDRMLGLPRRVAGVPSHRA